MSRGGRSECRPHSRRQWSACSRRRQRAGIRGAGALGVAFGNERGALPVGAATVVPAGGAAPLVCETGVGNVGVVGVSAGGGRFRHGLREANGLGLRNVSTRRCVRRSRPRRRWLRKRRWRVARARRRRRLGLGSHPMHRALRLSAARTCKLGHVRHGSQSAGTPAGGALGPRSEPVAAVLRGGSAGRGDVPWALALTAGPAAGPASVVVVLP